MKDSLDGLKTSINRRRFVKNGLTAASVATVGAGLLAHTSSLLAHEGPEERSGRLDRGDASILRFLAAAEILETDLWQQYNELGGIQDTEVPGGSGTQTTVPHSQFSTRTWPSISTTIPKTSLPMKSSSMPIWPQRARRQSTLTNFEHYPAAKRQERNK